MRIGDEAVVKKRRECLVEYWIHNGGQNIEQGATHEERSKIQIQLMDCSAPKKDPHYP